MNTFILNGTQKDVRLLLDISKKIGLDLKLVKEKMPKSVQTSKEKAFKKMLSQGLTEMKSIREGKIKAGNLEDLLDEL